MGSIKVTPSPLGLFYRWNAEHAFLEAAWADTPNRFLWSNVPGIDLILNDPEETRLVIAARDAAVTLVMEPSLPNLEEMEMDEKKTVTPTIPKGRRLSKKERAVLSPIEQARAEVGGLWIWGDDEA